MEDVVKLLIIGGILGVLVLVLGWGVYFWRRKKKIKDDDRYVDSDEEPVFIKKVEDQFEIPFTYAPRNQQLATCKLENTELRVEDYRPRTSASSDNEPTTPTRKESQKPIMRKDSKLIEHSARTSVIGGALTCTDDPQSRFPSQQSHLKRYKSSMTLKQKNITQDMMAKLESGKSAKGNKKTTLGLQPESRKISVYDSYSVDVGRKTLARRRGSKLTETLSFKKSGMIHFALEFHPNENQLEVYIARCSNLPTKKTNLNLFVRMCLSPGKKQRQDTQFVTKTTDPIFGETLYFRNIEREEIMKHKLKMKVYHQDKLRRNELFGRVDILLASVNLDARELFDINLFKQRSMISLSSVSITLCHQATFSKLEVTIGSLRKVPTRSKNSSIYGAVTLFKEEVSLSKNTSVKAQTKDPVFKETFTFEVVTNSGTPLNTFSLVFSLIERNIIGHDEIMGHVIFSMTSPQSSAIKQWGAVQNEPHSKITNWHFLVDPDEL